MDKQVKKAINSIAILQALVFAVVILLGVFFKSDLLRLEAELGSDIGLYIFPFVVVIGGVVFFISKPLRERKLDSHFIYHALLKHPLSHVSLIALIIFSVFNSS